MMKIAIDGRRIIRQSTGLGMYTFHLLKAILEAPGENECLFFLLPEAIKTLRQDSNKVKLESVIWPVENHLQGEVWKHWIMPGLLRKRGIEIFHDPAYQLPWFKMKRVKMVVTIHDLSPFLFPESNTAKYNFFWKTITRRSLRNADAVITVSDFIRNQVIDFFRMDETKVHTIHSGCPEDMFPGQVDAGTLGKHGIRNSFILSAAAYEPRKNIARLMEAYHLLKEAKGLDIDLVLAGKPGWKCGDIFNGIKTRDPGSDVIMTGYLPRTELLHLVRAARMVIVPSLYEGFGFPVLEAMACGTPVAASATSALPEIGGEAAVYFDPLDPADMAEKISGCLNDSQKLARHSAMGLTQASRFQWSVTVEKLMRVYRSLWNE